jgi:hypothetical protein
MSFVSCLSSLFNNTYNNYNILYCNKRILKECDMEGNREAAEAVTTAYRYYCIPLLVLTVTAA